MFDELWQIIESFPWFINDLYLIEVCVPARHYWTVRNALTRYVKQYPGERFILTMDHL